jgi:hypothetical protein
LQACPAQAAKRLFFTRAATPRSQMLRSNRVVVESDLIYPRRSRLCCFARLVVAFGRQLNFVISVPTGWTSGEHFRLFSRAVCDQIGNVDLLSRGC